MLASAGRTSRTTKSGRFWSVTSTRVEPGAKPVASAYTDTTFEPSSSPSSSVCTVAVAEFAPAGIVTVAGSAISDAPSCVSVTTTSWATLAELARTVRTPASASPSRIVAGSTSTKSAGPSSSTISSVAESAPPASCGRHEQPQESMRIDASIVTVREPPASISALSTTPIANCTDRVFAGIVTDSGRMSARSSLAARNTVIDFRSFSASSSVRSRKA